jgi:hypothetical protein
MGAIRAVSSDRPFGSASTLSIFIALVVMLSGCGATTTSMSELPRLPRWAAGAACLDGVSTVSFVMPLPAIHQQALTCGELAVAIGEASAPRAAQAYTPTIALIARERRQSLPSRGSAAYEETVRAIAVHEIAAVAAGVTERAIGGEAAAPNAWLDRGYQKTASVNLLWVTLEQLFLADGCVEPTEAAIAATADQTIDHLPGSREIRAALPGLVSALAIIHACDLGEKIAESVTEWAGRALTHMSKSLAQREAKRLHLERLPARGSDAYNRLVAGGLRSYIRTTVVGVAATVALATAPAEPALDSSAQPGLRLARNMDASDFYPLHSSWLSNRANEAASEVVTADDAP